MNWRLPEHWPEDIGRYWLQARRNIEDKNWEAAALMARSALQAALKNKNASGNSLKQEIDDLAAKSILTPVMKECAHQIRRLGNKSAHPETAQVIDSQDARDIVEFLTYLLQYLYTFPRQVQQYRDRQQVKRENLIERVHLEDSTPMADWNLTDEIHNELSTIAERFRARTTLEERETIGRKVAALRINAEGSKGMAWREIRRELRRTEGLHLEQEDLREVIRREDHFKESVVERIESFEGGWQYSGKLNALLGFEPVGELANRIEACKRAPKVEPKEDAKSYEYEGEPLNTPIIRSILNTSYPWQGSLPISAILEVLTQYHLERGGSPTQLRDFRTNTYDILCEMEAEGRAERYRESNKDYWCLI